MLYDVSIENTHEPFSLVIRNIYWSYSYVHEFIRGRNVWKMNLIAGRKGKVFTQVANVPFRKFPVSYKIASQLRKFPVSYKSARL